MYRAAPGSGRRWLVSCRLSAYSYHQHHQSRRTVPFAGRTARTAAASPDYWFQLRQHCIETRILIVIVALASNSHQINGAGGLLDLHHIRRKSGHGRQTRFVGFGSECVDGHTILVWRLAICRGRVGQCLRRLTHDIDAQINVESFSQDCNSCLGRSGRGKQMHMCRWYVTA